MPPPSEAPVFGIRLPGCRYVVRPSAYAIVRDAQGRIAVVRSPRGWFLPGGGIEAGESAEQAAVRETREESGLLIGPRAVLGTATEIVHSPAGNAGIDKASVFIDAAIAGTTPKAEADHELFWLPPAQAVERLSHKSHRWAVEQFAVIWNSADVIT
jgi:8-oxo-dGTP diphosphatase